MSRHCPDCPAQQVATWRRGTLTQVAVEHHRSCLHGLQQLPIRDWHGDIQTIPVDTPTVPTRRERLRPDRTTPRDRVDPPRPRRRR